MRVLVAHVAYRIRGGEDVVVDNELRLLRESGFDAERMDLTSAEFDALPSRERLAVAWHFDDHELGRRLVRDAVRVVEPTVVHFHNIYPLLGPGAIREARTLGCAVVETIHNYRLSCLAGTHVLKGEECHRCSAGQFTPGVLRRCYRHSTIQSALIAQALTTQWKDAVYGSGPHTLIFLNSRMRDFYVAMGFPASRATVKANSVPEGERQKRSPAAGALFVGRLSPEKGIEQLVRAWPADAPHLTVAGTGPLAEVLREAAGSNVELLGDVAPARVRELMRSVRTLLIPSTWPEGPLVLLEALAEGVPIVCFEGTAMADAVRDATPSNVVAPMGDFGAFVRVAVTSAQAVTTFPMRELQELHAARFSHVKNAANLGAIYESARLAALDETDATKPRHGA